MVSPSKATSLATGTVGGGTKVDAGAIAAPFRVEVREKIEALKAKGIGEYWAQAARKWHKICSTCYWRFELLEFAFIRRLV
jgi:hypothetical protein